MNLNNPNIFAVVTFALLGSSVARADLMYQYTTGSAESAMISSYEAGNSVYLNVGHEGVSGKTHLVYATYTPDTGYHYWNGMIPTSAITTTGITEMSISIDTCTIMANSACGIVDVTVSKDVATTPLINTGVSQSMYGGVLYQTAGSYTTYTADAAGFVNGIAVNTTTRAWIGRYNNVSVTVSSGN